MANLLFLALAVALLLVAVFSLISYIRDRKKQKFTFKKRRQRQQRQGDEHALSPFNLRSRARAGAVLDGISLKQLKQPELLRCTQAWGSEKYIIASRQAIASRTGSVYFYLRNYCSGTQSDYCLYKTIETAVTTLMIVVTTLAVLSLFVLSLAKVGIAVSNNPDEF